MAQKGVNKAIIVGNLGADPETRYTAGGTAVTNINVATSETWKDKHQGNQVERTEWHRVVFFARLAEVAGEYLAKGSKVYVEGRLRTRKWQGQDGKDRYTTEIIADQMQMLGTPAAGSGSSKNNASSRQTQTNDYRTARDGGGQAPSHGAPPSEPELGGDDLDDDIPF